MLVNNHDICLMPFKFEKLLVWQKALVLADEINELLKTFPNSETYVLGSQIKRAADSVSLNIIEGSTNQSVSEFKRFLRYALRSALEVVGCIFLAKGRRYLDELMFKKIYALCEEIVVMLNALSRAVK